MCQTKDVPPAAKSIPVLKATAQNAEYHLYKTKTAAPK